MAQFPLRSLLRGEITAHGRNIHWMPGSGVVDAKPIHEKGHRPPGLEVAKSELASPAAHSHENRPALLARAVAVLGNQEIKYMQSRKFCDRRQTDELETGGIEIVWRAIQARNADEIRGSFDQGYESFLYRFRAPSLQRDGRAVRPDTEQKPLHASRETRLLRSRNDHRIPTKADWSGGDADCTLAKGIGDNSRLLGLPKPRVAQGRENYLSRIGCNRLPDADGFGDLLAFAARQADIDEIRSEHGE